MRTERCMHRLREHTGGGSAFRRVRIQQTIRRIAGRRGINVVLDHDAVDVARGQLTARRSGEAGHIRHKPVGLLIDKAARYAAERIVRAEAEYIRERGGIVCAAGRPAQRLEQPGGRQGTQLSGSMVQRRRQRCMIHAQRRNSLRAPPVGRRSRVDDMGDCIARNALHRGSKNMTGGIGWHNISPFPEFKRAAHRPAQTDFPQAPANSITQNIAKCQKKRYTNLRQKMRREKRALWRSSSRAL